MHEWALAESVVKTIIDKNLSAKSVEVIFGQLQDIDKEIFNFALCEIVKQNKILGSLKIKIVLEKAQFKCLNCSKEFNLASAANTPEEKENIHFLPEMAKAFIKCPSCKSVDFEILKGRGLSLRIKGVKK